MSAQQLINNEAVVICTRNRSDQLHKTLAHILIFPAITEWILLVDASDKPNIAYLKFFNPTSKIKLIHLESAASIPLQRNKAVNYLSSTEVEIIHFIDDDFIPDKDYFSNLSAFMKSNSGCKIAGGIISNNQQQMSHLKLWHKLALLDSKKPGKLLFSGYTSEPQARNDLNDKSPFRVDWVSGCSMSVKYDVFNSIKFDERLKGYAQDEDLDFCLSQPPNNEIWVVPKSKGTHLRLSHITHEQRINKRETAIFNRYKILIKHKKNPLRKIAFYFSNWISILGMCRNWEKNRDFISISIRSLLKLIKKAVA